MTAAPSMSFLDTLLARTLRLAGCVLLLVMVVWLALLGLALGAGLLLWSLLRGRRTARRFAFGPGAADWQRLRREGLAPRRARRSPSASSPAGSAEVIEGQAREVPPR